ncbi:MAG: chorismate mutase [Pseudomonadota bacterium]
MTHDEDPTETLNALRKSIDRLDAAAILLLAERFKLTQDVGRLKQRHNLPPADPSREEKMIARLRTLAADSDLDPDFAEKFIRFVIDEVIRHHERIKQNGG